MLKTFALQNSTPVGTNCEWGFVHMESMLGHRGHAFIQWDLKKTLKGRHVQRGCIQILFLYDQRRFLFYSPQASLDV